MRSYSGGMGNYHFGVKGKNMSLITSSPILTTKDKILFDNTACLNQMKRTAKNVFNLFWNNPSQTAQQVCTSFGTDAVTAFYCSNQ